MPDAHELVPLDDMVNMICLETGCERPFVLQIIEANAQAYRVNGSQYSTEYYDSTTVPGLVEVVRAQYGHPDSVLRRNLQAAVNAHADCEIRDNNESRCTLADMVSNIIDEYERTVNRV